MCISIVFLLFLCIEHREVALHFERVTRSLRAPKEPSFIHTVLLFSLSVVKSLPTLSDPINIYFVCTPSLRVLRTSDQGVCAFSHLHFFEDSALCSHEEHLCV